MRLVASRRSELIVGLFAIMLLAAGCGSSDVDDASASASATGTSTSTAEPSDTAPPSPVAENAAPEPTETTVTGEDDVQVTLTGPIAVKYASATEAQRAALGKPLTGDHNAGTRESGVVYQQFRGGVTIAKNSDPATPGYIVTSGKIRDAWNTERAPDGTPLLLGTNGSAGPLGVPTSDVTIDGDLEVVTFEHGEISENTETGEVTVTVNGKIVPSGLR
ncbi:LGFP repeat-containing protein [Gordonia sp. NPDC127522]|uniref:LGFP repeat-containing protein n=1 Tax=Gordonia sp. NPDC127522 TaxID=3345390 RepID=UPI0036416357